MIEENYISIIYREFYFTDWVLKTNFTYNNPQSTARDVFLAKLVEGTRGKVTLFTAF